MNISGAHAIAADGRQHFFFLPIYISMYRPPYCTTKQHQINKSAARIKPETALMLCSFSSTK